ncbi:putative nucleic acid-binding protein [Dyadobacter sp. BE34]|uniref:Nucleic acid-binding protein n=1 Tax=Dyadobacter fermentans TaxID=94254 RepID=A0ABU1QSJ6_9BACT|nr:MULTISPECIES: type II toxin-antitoxin system VapC family toxin [Dyadobacter]MDR6804135.1 putative nucleic acid-binding protein [Dyadobacter fermentans]MDR7041875.1 putative nucleic acid-binding protein [Dyadobacter sp. BE242]MDR7196278.1 putative nucleic acid-binding protein [Dyadobacter sp. BE34]MDR7213177.1 putative nucleic acid-binding protein [Dyadobacter sp. BE31]MDR7261684.1 putative nucleic acid-binding protein [Dyadobacter sp. BE32]
MEKRYLIDTSAVIKYLNATLPPPGLILMDGIIDDESIISLITEIELRVWEPTDAADKDIYEAFIKGSVVLDLNRDIIDQTIVIRKKYRLKLPDAFIAATAIVNNLTLIADNDRDFGKVDILKYVNPNH